ncbi:ATP-binding response regulator [Desulfocicer niacini]
METSSILIVEDEFVIAKDIQISLENMGYLVCAIVSSGEEAITKAKKEKPDLVLMDIILKGEIDGIEAGRQIWSLFKIPIVYLTAYADENTLEKAKISEPYGYILKPFKNRELNIAIEIALYKNKMEKKLIQSEERFKFLAENMADIVWTLDLNFQTTYVSPSIEKVLGFTPAERKLQPLEEMVTPESLSQIAETFSQELELEKVNADPDRVLTMEVEYYHKNGTIVWTESNIKAMREPGGKLIGIYGSSRDITERKHFEEQRRQAHKMESIGTLAGGIAHDFNNIMGIILGNTELALEDVPKLHPAHSSLEGIRKASLRAANIVRQLLSFTRITDQNLQSIEIVAVIKDALKFLRSTIPTTIDIVQDICVTDETILADPTQINQIMMNLCINASHAMEQTGGKLTIAVENVLLDNSSAKDYPDLKIGTYVKLMVSDTGPGIDPKIMDRIFDPYFTTKGIGKGSGMGLAVVHGIVKNHRGTIAVDSTLGKGTKFSILFPLSQGKAAVEAKTIQEIPRGNETILFVDDEISIANMVQRMFERLGYKVQTATTPQDALDRFSLNPNHFDLIITDMTMPQMTGINLSEKLMDIRPDIPIIICTGHSALVDEEKAKEFGLAAYVMKPIEIREIAQTIRNVLDRIECPVQR